MTPTEAQELQSQILAIAEILYRNTAPVQLQDFEQIESTVRQQTSP